MRNHQLDSVEAEIGFLEEMLAEFDGGEIPLSYLSFAGRIKELRQEAERLRREPIPVTAELFVDSNRIRHTHSIDARFASDLLDGVDKITCAIRKQAEVDLAGRRKKPAPVRNLLTATLRGSFGFRIEEEVVGPEADDSNAVTGGLREFGEILERLSGSDDEFYLFLAETPPPVRAEVGKFFGTVASNNAMLRFENDDRRVVIAQERVKSVAEQMQRDVFADEVQLPGRIVAVITSRRGRPFEAIVTHGENTETMTGALASSVSKEEAHRLQGALRDIPGMLLIRKTKFSYQHRERVVLALTGFIPDDPKIPPVL